MTDYESNLFIYITETLSFASTQSSVVGTNTLGIGTFQELAGHLNKAEMFSPSGRRWTGHSLEVWIARYLNQHPRARDILDREHLGAMDTSYLSNTPAYYRKQPFEEVAENYWFNAKFGGWELTK